MPDVKCQRCQRIYPAEQYVLDYRYKLVVCPQCAKEKEVKPKPEPIPQAEVINKPVLKSQEKVVNQPAEKIKVRCKKCKFEFKYDEKRKTPSRCPYCSSELNM